MRKACVQERREGACKQAGQAGRLHAWLTMIFLGCSSRRMTSSTVVLRMLLVTCRRAEQGGQAWRAEHWERAGRQTKHGGWA